MKTSEGQFQVLVDFMERHGDLLKPVDGPHGRQQAAQRWTELTNLLNMDTTGEPKTLDRWKKVWSDFKNNSKRKRAKINRSARGTGGGPACKLVMTDLEERVLNLIGVVAATGMPGVSEVGVELPQVQSVEPGPSILSSQLSHDSPSILQALNVIPIETHEVVVAATSDQLPPNPEEVEHGFASPNREATSTPFHMEVVEADTLSPTSRHAHHSGRPAAPARRRAVRASPRARGAARQRRATSRHRHQEPDVGSMFLQSDQRWCALATKINETMATFATESLRLREAELRQRQAQLEVQTQWQALFAKFVTVLEKFNNK